MVQVTVVPGFTESAAGLNAKFWMVTVLPAGGAAAPGTAGAAGAGDVAGGLCDAQPATTRARISRTMHPKEER